MITERTNQKPIITQMREAMRRIYYAYKTENTYCDLVQRFIKFSNMKSKSALFENAETKVEDFLTDLAVKQNVATGTQNQAFNALRPLCNPQNPTPTLVILKKIFIFHQKTQRLALLPIFFVIFSLFLVFYYLNSKL